MSDSLSVRIDNHRTLWLTEIARKIFDDQGLDDLESDGGLFVVLEDDLSGRFDVLAKAASSDSGQSLLEIVAQALLGGGTAPVNGSP